MYRKPIARAAWLWPTPIWIAAFAVALLGQLADLAHLWVVSHATCAEHGELVHVEPLERALRMVPEAALEELADNGHRHRHLREEHSSEGDEHDHCRLSTNRKRLQPDAPSAIAARYAGEVELSAPSFLTHRAHDALYRLAPKSSPPA